jgi:ribonuclease HI
MFVIVRNPTLKKYCQMFMKINTNERRIKMPGISIQSKSINKHQLLNRKEIPAKEKETFDDWLWDQETLRVFVDGSELKNRGIFGLGAIYVGQGTTVVISKKHYNQAMKRVNVYAEIVAVEFALEKMEKVISGNFQNPSEIIVYSDWNEIDKLKESAMFTNRITAINAIAEKINERKHQFLAAHPEVELDISYLGEGRKYNHFYLGAHNAARKIIGI